MTEADAAGAQALAAQAFDDLLEHLHQPEMEHDSEPTARGVARVRHSLRTDPGPGPLAPYLPSGAFL